MLKVNLLRSCATFATAFAMHAPNAFADVISDTLGASYIACRGAVSWKAEGEDEASAPEALQLAVPDHVDARAIAIFHREADFSSHDIWTCSEGLCMSFVPLGSGVTTNVLRLTPGYDLGSGRQEYAVSAVFSVIANQKVGLVEASSIGRGAVICEKHLPSGVITLQE